MRDLIDIVETLEIDDSHFGGQQCKRFTFTDHPILENEQLVELFDSSDITWERHNRASWEVNGIVYDAHFGIVEQHQYEFLFGVRHGLTTHTGNTGDMKTSAPRVFGLALRCIEEFLKREKPEKLSFAGSIKNKKDIIYTKMAKALEPKISKLGYMMTSEITFGSKLFHLIKMGEGVERIDELFDTANVTWINNGDNPVAEFTVNNKKYTAYFDKEREDENGNEYFTFLFGQNPDVVSDVVMTGNTGDVGSAAAKVFGLAVRCIEGFIKKKNPAEIYFSGNIHNGKADLYKKMAKVLKGRLQNLNYGISTETGSAILGFYIRPLINEAKIETIASATMKSGEINRSKATKMIDPQGFFHPKSPIAEEIETDQFSAIVYHGSPKIFDKFNIDENYGVYFSNDIDYARHYGNLIYKCRVTLNNPKYRDAFDQKDRGSNLMQYHIENGYDGQVVRYADGAIDVIVFHPEQIEILDASRM